MAIIRERCGSCGDLVEIDEPRQVGEVVATACGCGRLALLAWRESTDRVATRIHVRPGQQGQAEQVLAAGG